VVMACCARQSANNKATHPTARGLAIPVRAWIFVNTSGKRGVMAPPGVVTVIPQSPSAVGPTAPRKRRSRVDWGRTGWWANRKTIRTILPLSFWATAAASL